MASGVHYAEYHGRVLPKLLVDEIVKANGPVAHVGTLHSQTVNVNVKMRDDTIRKGMVNKVHGVSRERSNGVRYTTYYVSGVLKLAPHSKFTKKVTKDEAESIAEILGVKITIQRERKAAKPKSPSMSSHFQWRLPF